MTGKRRRFSAEFKARVVRAALRDYQTLAEARLGRYFGYYNHLRCHRGLDRRTPTIM